MVIPNRVLTAGDTNRTIATITWVMQQLAAAGLIDRVKLSPAPLRYGLFEADSTLDGGSFYGDPVTGRVTIYPGPDILPALTFRAEMAGYEPADSASIGIGVNGEFLFVEYTTGKIYRLSSFDSTRTMTLAANDSLSAHRTNLTNILNGTYIIPQASVAGVALYVGWGNVGAKPAGIDYAMDSLAVHRTAINSLLASGGGSGTSYYSGSGAPSGALGTDGSIYWDTVGLMEYRKLGGTWRQQP